MVILKKAIQRTREIEKALMQKSGWTRRKAPAVDGGKQARQEGLNAYTRQKE